MPEASLGGSVSLPPWQALKVLGTLVLTGTLYGPIPERSSLLYFYRNRVTPSRDSPEIVTFGYSRTLQDVFFLGQSKGQVIGNHL